MQMFVSQIPIISGLDDQSKFQMFTEFSGRHIGVPRMYTNWWFSLSRNKKIKSKPFNDRSYEFQILYKINR